MKTIILRDGVTTVIVDDEDFEKVNAKAWYAAKKSNQKKSKIYARSGGQDLQRFLIPEVPPGHIVRFANENSLDCRRGNLIVVSRKEANTFKNFDRNKYIKEKKQNKKSTKEPESKRPAIPQLKTENFIGIYPEVVYKLKMVNGVLKNVEEKWYVAQYIDSNNRVYHFGRFKDPKVAAREYNKQVQLVAVGLREEVELNPKELLA